MGKAQILVRICLAFGGGLAMIMPDVRGAQVIWAFVISWYCSRALPFPFLYDVVAFIFSSRLPETNGDHARKGRRAIAFIHTQWPAVVSLLFPLKMIGNQANKENSFLLILSDQALFRFS